MSGATAQITSLFTNLPNLYAIYSTQVPNTIIYRTESQKLDKEIQGLNLQKQELNRQEETYDREFLDRRAAAPPKGILYLMGLRTTEDWVFAYFFFSYFMFFLLLLITVLIYSEKKSYGSAIVVGAGLIFGVLSLYLLYRYA
jgi:hypothetical protein